MCDHKHRNKHVSSFEVELWSHSDNTAHPSSWSQIANCQDDTAFLNDVITTPLKRLG